MEQRLNTNPMTSLAPHELSFVSAGSDSARVDLGQFLGAYAKSVVTHAYFGPLTGAYAFFEAVAYALSE